MNQTTYTNPNANFFSPGQGGNPILPKAPAVASPIDASSLQSSSNVNLNPSTIPRIPNITNLSSSEVTPTPITPLAPPTAPNLFDRITGGITDLLGNSKNKETDLASAIDNTTLPYTQQLNELNTQIKTQQANALSNQEKAMRSGETTGFASREAQNVQRTDAIETLKLSALAEGMRGNIALATQHATNAINAKYADINKQIEDAKTNIYDNYDSFSAAEKKKADLTLLRLDKDDAFAKNQMENEKAVSAVIQSAIKQGQTNGSPVPSLILAQANKLTDPTEATALLAPYLKDAAAIQKKIDDHNTALMTQAKLGQEISDAQIKNMANNSVVDPVTGKATSELKVSARDAAATLLDRVLKGNGTSGVGGSRILGLQYIPGTNASDFKVQFDNLKSILSLDNVKLLKGQGAVSDSERALLAAASANLNLSQSDKEFKKNLVKISIGLGNPQEVTLTDKSGKSQKVTVDADTLNKAISDGLTVTY